MAAVVMAPNRSSIGTSKVNKGFQLKTKTHVDYVMTMIYSSCRSHVDNWSVLFTTRSCCNNYHDQLAFHGTLFNDQA